MPSPEPYDNAAPVAQLLKVTRAYVCKQALLGRIPAYNLAQPGGRAVWRFKLSEIEKWMRQHRKGAA